MAAPLTVPRRYQVGFAKIRDLDDTSAHELLTALQKLPSTVDPASLSSAIATAVNTIAASDIEEIVPAILQIYSIREVSEESVPEVAEGIARGMEEVVSRRLKSSEEQRDSFQARLAELLSINSLSVIVRAGGLFFENEHSLRQTRIITDIRPVFEQEHRQAPPKGAVIVHTLKVSYWADGEAKDFFVALDSGDIRKLLEQLEWADSKAESLKAVLDAAQVPYIDAE